MQLSRMLQSHAGMNVEQGVGSLQRKGHKSWKAGRMGSSSWQLCPLVTAGICGVHYRHVVCKSNAGVNGESGHNGQKTCIPVHVHDFLIVPKSTKEVFQC